MREIKTHRARKADELIGIFATDAPGAGGANHRYVVTMPLGNNVSSQANDPHGKLVILFQNGPVRDDGIGANGVTIETLLAIAADRLESFQAGPFACDENAAALAGIREALMQLHGRTLARMARGVEGKMEK